MSDRQGTVLAGAAGVLFAILSVSRVLYSGEIHQPTWEDPPEALTDFYANTSFFDFRFMIAMGAVLVGYSLFVLFIARLVHVLATRHKELIWVGIAIFGFALLDVVCVLAYVGATSAARQWATMDVTSADTHMALVGFAYGLYWTDLIVQPFWLLLLGGAIMTTRMFPWWFGLVMVASAAIQFVIFFLPEGTWDVTGLTYLWVLILGILMIRRPDAYLAC